MTHNESFKTFDDIVHYLELEAKQLVVARSNEFNSCKAFNCKCNKKSLKRKRNLMMLQRKGRLWYSRGLSMLRSIRTS